MITKKGIGIGIIYFIMFPLCFQAAIYLENWRVHLNGTAASTNVWFLTSLAVGLAAGLFIWIMTAIGGSLNRSCRAGKSIDLIIIIVNILFALAGLLWVLPKGNNYSLVYFDNINYFYLICILLVVTIANMCRKKK